MVKTTYITTPIYYVNSVPHVGHGLTMLVCDVFKRFHEFRGEKVVFLTGTDENGLKVFEAAQAAGEDPHAFVDRISVAFKNSADLLKINYDIFFRTTSPEHKTTVQALFKKLQENGAIYLDKYEGWYDVSSETFLKESELVDGKSPDGNEVRWVSEENYFFKLSDYGDRLLDHAKANPEFWLPSGRRAEVESFIRQGLRDICITRHNAGWGIPVPGDDSRVIYVWFDALINYLAATGWPNEGWQKLWPADTHWMAKEIFTRFHATLWPAMLMAADLPLPKTIIAHGWFTFRDHKMSKSKGNVLAPEELIEHFVAAGCSRELAVDAVRFSLIRSLPFDDDSNYSLGIVDRLYNSDLANDLGNALNRTLSMAHKFVGGVVPDASADPEVQELIRKTKEKMESDFAQHKSHLALDAALGLARELNRYVDQSKPWDLNKNGDPKLASVIKTMLMLLRASEGCIRPFMPACADQIATQLGHSPTANWTDVGNESSLVSGTSLQTPTPMYPRIEIKEVMETTKENPPEKAAPTPEVAPETELIDFDQFMKVKLRVGRVIEAEPVEKSGKLMKLEVLIGEERRQILAGIKKSHTTEDLIGRQVIVVANLKPAKLMGMESQGMILAADGPEGEAILLQPERETPEGTSVH